MSRISTQSSRSNLEQAFGVAEQLGVARLLDPEGEFQRQTNVLIHVTPLGIIILSETTFLWLHICKLYLKNDLSVIYC